MKGQENIVILTRHTPVTHKFCEENHLQATVYPWKLGGPSFVMKGNSGKLLVITDELIGNLL